jgi:hypothetical protein
VKVTENNNAVQLIFFADDNHRIMTTYDEWIAGSIEEFDCTYEVFEEEDDEYVLLLPKTKHGYVKEGFVVSSDAEDDDEDADEDDDEDEDDDIAEHEDIEEVVAKPKEKGKKVVAKPKKPKLREEPEPTVYCEELVEDSYLE